MPPDSDRPRMDRRSAIKWMLTATASLTMLDRTAAGASRTRPVSPATGYGPDPDLLKTYAPGDLWPLTLDPPQRRTVTALCDIIIPEDAHSPAASTVGVPDFIDEWVSSPYPDQAPDRDLILQGLAFLDNEARQHDASSFVALSPPQQLTVCRQLAIEAKAGNPSPPAQFFHRIRYLIAGAYYTTPVGMKDLGYIGNVPMAAFAGPPAAALRHVEAR